MDLERQKIVMKALDEALACSPEGRSDLLERLCGDDCELRQEVEALLATAEQDSAFLGSPVFSIHDHDTATDSLIGPYRRQRLLGHGGMGSVYLAVRADELHYRVALKVIRRGLESDEIVRRFHNERQILADLRHPNIARLLDGGTTADGRPWFAMEYVEGEPIDRYCDAHRLSVRERLLVFRKVCAAVLVAHQSLVVHRDLKPANILVDVDGEPHLLDFGIAKLLVTESSTGVTTTGQHSLMTPAYASPEQVRGEPITTASDTYSLGVLLYLLLVGHPPYRLDNRSASQTEQVICQQEPPRPSTAVFSTDEVTGDDGSAVHLSPEKVSQNRGCEPAQLRRRLAGDLDSIVLKALRKETEQRYGSVEQLAADIDNYLRNLPVAARGGALAYRTRKLLGRHRLALSVAAILGLLVGGFTIAQTLQLHQTIKQRDRADRLVSGMETLLETVQPSTPRPEKEEIKIALGKVAVMIDETLGEYPLDQAVLLNRLGRAYCSLALFDDAAPLLERALAIRQEQLGKNHLLVAEVLTNLGYHSLETGGLPTAETYLRRSLAIKLDHWQEHDFRLAPVLTNLAMVLRERGEGAEAEALFRRVLAMRTKEYGENSPLLVGTLNNLGALLVDNGKYQEAVKQYESGLAIRIERYGPDHQKVSISRNSLAVALFNLGELERAASLTNQALQSRITIYGEDHPRVATTRCNLGMVLHAQGLLGHAETELRKALEILRLTLAEDHGNVAATKRNLAAVLAHKNPRQGEGLARQALATYHKRLTSDSWQIAYTEGVLGACLTGLQRYDEAEELLLSSYHRVCATRGESTPYTRNLRNWVVELYQALGKPDQAEAFFAGAEGS